MASSSVYVVLIIGTCFLVSNVLATAPEEPKVTWQEDVSNQKAVIKEPKFNYQEVEEWGSKSPSFKPCSYGKRQSPIDINTYEVVVNKTLEPLERNYRVANASLATEGTIIEVFFGSIKGGLKIDGKIYKLAQFHLHTPSEHRLNGVQYAAELHQVHSAEDGNRAVVGVLFKLGPASPFIDMMMPQLQELAKKPCAGHQISTNIPKFKSSFLRIWPRNYYRYHGSLTTPPCDENVLWSLLTEVKTISKEQVEALRAPVCEENKKNARPTQPLNGRKVQHYDQN